MARGGKKSGKKPEPARRDTASRGAAGTPAVTPKPAKLAPEPATRAPLTAQVVAAQAERVQEAAKPSRTNDDPWRDLHPARVWPD
jgi:hypothetical protein